MKAAAAAAAARHSIRRREALADALSGVIASLVALWVFYPIELYKTTIQAQAAPSSSSSNDDETTTNKKKNNHMNVFRGIHIKTLYATSSSFCYFYLYSWIFSWWTPAKGQKNISTVQRLLLTAVAAMLNTTLTLPLDVISANHQTNNGYNVESNATTNQEEEEELNKPSTAEASPSTVRLMDQAWGGADTNEHRQQEYNDESMPATVTPSTYRRMESLMSRIPTEIHIPASYKSLWKGLWPSLLLCTNPAIHYTVFDVLKGLLMSKQTRTHSQQHRLSMGEAFLVGLLAKFTATMVTYPLIRAKIILMVTQQNSMIQCLIREYRKEGAAGLYRGWQYQLLHTMLKSALLMMVRERIAESTRRAIVR